MKYPKLGKEHRYLGHFAKHLKEGHNTNKMPKILEGIVKGDLPPKKDEKKPIPKAPLPGGIRG